MSIMVSGLRAAQPAPDQPDGVIRLWQIRPVIKSALDSGVDVAQLFSELGYKAPLHDLDDDTPIKLTDYFRLQRLAAQTLDDLTFQLSARKLTYRTGDFILSQLQQSRTLKDAIESLCEHFNMMHGDRYNFARRRGESLVLTVDDSTFPYTFRDNAVLMRFVGDTVLIKVHCLLASLSRGLADRALRRVSVLRTREEAGGGQNSFWTVPILFDQPVYELIYDFDATCEPIPDLSDADLTTLGMFAHVITYLENRDPNRVRLSFTARVRELIHDGVENQVQLALDLGLSPATLRRRLSGEGTSFRQMLQEARLANARRLLDAGRSISDVSDQLGYSDVRAFNRAFKKVRGLTPAQYVRSVSR